MFSLLFPGVLKKRKKKNVFQILLRAIRSFPHCQSLFRCLDGSHEFAGRLHGKPPLLSPATHQPAPIRREMASGLFAARMAALMGRASGGRVPPFQLGGADPLAGGILPPRHPLPSRTLSLPKPRSLRTSLLPFLIFGVQTGAMGKIPSKSRRAGILLPFGFPPICRASPLTCHQRGPAITPFSRLVFFGKALAPAVADKVSL